MVLIKEKKKTKYVRGIVSIEEKKKTSVVTGFSPSPLELRITK